VSHLSCPIRIITAKISHTSPLHSHQEVVGMLTSLSSVSEYWLWYSLVPATSACIICMKGKKVATGKESLCTPGMFCAFSPLGVPIKGWTCQNSTNVLALHLVVRIFFTSSVTALPKKPRNFWPYAQMGSNYWISTYSSQLHNYKISALLYELWSHPICVA